MFINSPLRTEEEKMVYRKDLEVFQYVDSKGIADVSNTEIIGKIAMIEGVTCQLWKDGIRIF
jgi:hypothetical protein